VYAACWGGLLAVLDLILFTPWQTSLKQQAAKIQELFDCAVLRIPWQELKVGRPPDLETVTEWADPAGASYDALKLTNWYAPEVGEVPLPIARIICQRTNCWWDAKLRRRVANWNTAAISGILVLITLGGLIGHVTFKDFLLGGVLAFLPLFVLGLRQATEQRQAAARLDHLRDHAEQLWDHALARAVDDDDLGVASRVLQDEVFDQRRKNPLIFDWIYFRLRDRQEELMNKNAHELVREAKQALSH
jgi:hypothetical protein